MRYFGIILCSIGTYMAKVAGHKSQIRTHTRSHNPPEQEKMPECFPCSSIARLNSA